MGGVSPEAGEYLVDHVEEPLPAVAVGDRQPLQEALAEAISLYLSTPDHAVSIEIMEMEPMDDPDATIQLAKDSSGAPRVHRGPGDHRPDRRHREGHARASTMMPKIPRELDDLMYTVPMVAAVIHVSDKTVTLMIDRGELPAMRIGRRILVSKVELERWCVTNSCTVFPGYAVQPEQAHRREP
jgi:excisionase family DNA binding protein